jgi:pSer/pThr/pTyr-binding forkhead associated (FHA) protein
VKEAAVLWLEVVGGKDNGQVFPVLSETDFVQIGRCSTCTVFLHSPTVAKHHALFIPRQGRFLYCYRLNRGYRTLVNGLEVVPPFSILDGDEIQVGEFMLRFRAE